MIAPFTPLDFLVRTALTFPETTAVVDGPRRFTYTQFRDRVLHVPVDALGRVLNPDEIKS